MRRLPVPARAARHGCPGRVDGWRRALDRSPSRGLRAALVMSVLIGVVVMGWGGPAQGVGSQSTGDTSSGSHRTLGPHRTTGADRDRRRSDAKAAHETAIAGLHEARQSESEAKRHLDDLSGETNDLESQLRALGGEQQSATDRVAVARRHAREYAVEAYIGGGPPSFTAYFLSTPDANDLAWRNWMVRDHVGRAYGAVGELAQARDGVERQVDELAQRLDQNRAARQAAQNDLERARALVVEAEDDLATAEQERRDAELEQPDGPEQEVPVELFEVRGYRGAGDDGSPTPDESGNAKGPGWAALRHCESSGNYNIVDSSGTYRGAYQFDLQTWRGVGGHGDPIDNSTAEQDLRAQILYDSRGAQPWPICGRHLRSSPEVTTAPDGAPSTSSSTSTSVSPSPSDLTGGSPRGGG